ncbi:MAG: signal peptide peptidase SppA [Hyphomicrobiaceae bacterium]|nr:signal peptide peptidase SppA [Hyphomicrobiaceae bacterium]
MTTETETVLDRRRLRRKMALWRALAVLALAITIGVALASRDDFAALFGKKQIARVTISGTITEDRDQLRMLKRIAEADNVAGLILFVNSPGGTTTGGEALYAALRDVSEKKPVVAQFGTVAASAGYIVGLATDHIVARGNTITGSVGVLMQWPEVSGLLNTVGVKMNEVKSGTLKAEPSPFKPADGEALRVAQEMIDDGFRWFVGLVEERRGVKVTDIPGLREGRIFSGRQALELKLVDEIGGEPEAKLWLETKRGIDKDLDVVDWKPRDSGADTWLMGSARNLGRAVVGGGLAGLGEAVGAAGGLTTLGLDGLVSVWHPAEK